MSGLYLFEGFDGEIISTEEQFQLPKAQPDVIEDVLDIKEVAS